MKTERETFEDAARKFGFMMDMLDGYYAEPYTRKAFLLWQEARAALDNPADDYWDMPDNQKARAPAEQAPSAVDMLKRYWDEHIETKQPLIDQTILELDARLKKGGL